MFRQKLGAKLLIQKIAKNHNNNQNKKLLPQITNKKKMLNNPKMGRTNSLNKRQNLQPIVFCFTLLSMVLLPLGFSLSLK